jgi:hypothetical protein
MPAGNVDVGQNNRNGCASALIVGMYLFSWRSRSERGNVFSERGGDLTWIKSHVIGKRGRHCSCLDRDGGAIAVLASGGASRVRHPTSFCTDRKEKLRLQ